MLLDENRRGKTGSGGGGAGGGGVGGSFSFQHRKRNAIIYLFLFQTTHFDCAAHIRTLFRIVFHSIVGQ